MVAKHVLILDDISSLAELIKGRLIQDFNDRISVECLSSEADLKARLDSSLARETVLLVNAGFKSHPAATRCEFAGIQRTIKLSLRLTWLNQTPVIAYSTIPADAFLKLAVGSVFRCDPAHVYLNVAGLWNTNLRPVVEGAAPVPGDQALRKLISRSCRAELNEFVNRVLHHPLGKTYKLDSQVGRREFIDCFKHLERILDPITVDSSLLRDLKRVQRGLVNYEDLPAKKEIEVRKKIRSIREKLKEVIG